MAKPEERQWLLPRGRMWVHKCVKNKLQHMRNSYTNTKQPRVSQQSTQLCSFNIISLTSITSISLFQITLFCLANTNPVPTHYPYNIFLFFFFCSLLTAHCSSLSVSLPLRMCDQEWVKVAMADDILVVEMLLRLHQAEFPLSTTPPLPPQKNGVSSPATACAPSLQLDWTVRQRRSKSTMKHVDSFVKKTEPTSTRASPTTPLSWSGGTSVSNNAVADASEESSRPNKHVETSRSKVAVLTEMTTAKRIKRKKTLAELRDEESSLLRERKLLRKELAVLFVNLEKQRAKNKSLKRMKLDILSRRAFESATASTSSEKTISEETHFRDRNQQFEPVDSLPSIVASNPSDDNESNMYPRNISPQVPGIGNKETSFALPDLNLPLEEDLGPSDLHKVN